MQSADAPGGQRDLRGPGLRHHHSDALGRFTASGTVTYSFFASTVAINTCSGTPSPAGHGHPNRHRDGAQLQHRGAAGGGPLRLPSDLLGRLQLRRLDQALCEPFTVAAPPQVSQITPTQTTCSDFAGGTSSTLSQIQYSVKAHKISQVNPGVFFYWVAVPTTGTYTITQTTSETSKLFLVASGSSAYDGSCTKLSTSIGQDTTTGTVTVTFSGGTGPFYIGIKYSTSNVVGEAAPAPSTTVTYTFSTTGVPSTSTIDLVKR